MKKTARKAGPGRSTRYKAEYAAQAKIVCEEAGFSVSKLAKLFNVAKSTIIEWQGKHPEFAEAIAMGKDSFCNIQVEKSLYKRAMGYSTKEVILGVPDELDLSEGQAITEADLVPVRVVKKEIPPDTAAIRYYLNNRSSEKWKDKQTLNHEGGVTLTWEDALGKLEGGE